MVLIKEKRTKKTKEKSTAKVSRSAHSLEKKKQIQTHALYNYAATKFNIKYIMFEIRRNFKLVPFL